MRSYDPLGNFNSFNAGAEQERPEYGVHADPLGAEGAGQHEEKRARHRVGRQRTRSRIEELRQFFQQRSGDGEHAEDEQPRRRADEQRRAELGLGDADDECE